MKSPELLELYKSAQQRITSSPEEWVEFLCYASGIYKHEFHNAVLAYTQSPEATMLANYTTWRDHANRGVVRGAKPVYAYRSGNSPLMPDAAIEPIYDVRHTYGDVSTIPFRWSASREFFTHLESVHGDMAVLLNRYMQDAHLAEQPRIVSRFPNVDVSLFDYSRDSFVRDSVMTVILNRMELEVYQSIPHNVVTSLSDDIAAFTAVGHLITRMSKNVLTKFERHLLEYEENPVIAPIIYAQFDLYPAIEANLPTSAPPDAQNISVTENIASSDTTTTVIHHEGTDTPDTVPVRPMKNGDTFLIEGVTYTVIDSSELSVFAQSSSGEYINLPPSIKIAIQPETKEELEPQADVTPLPTTESYALSTSMPAEDTPVNSISPDTPPSSFTITVGDVVDLKNRTISVIFTIGDIVYLEDNKPFIIEGVTAFPNLSYSLSDPSLIYPIWRNEYHDTLIHLIQDNERNLEFARRKAEQDEFQTSLFSPAVSLYPQKLPDVVPAAELSLELPAPDSPVTTPIPSTAPVIYEIKEDTVFSEAVAPGDKPGNFRIPDDFDQGGSPRVKFRQNIAAIRLLYQLEAEERSANPEEQHVLAKYAGWGGLSQAFDPLNDDWSKEYEELRRIVVDNNDYAAAAASTPNSHYTSIEVIDAIYAALERLGYDGKGNLLEPAMGVGNFFGRLPEAFLASSLYGVELDSISGRISQQLYPDATIEIKGFEKSLVANEGFDIAVGNVPFGSIKLYDPKFRDHNFLIHDYFLAKTLDKLREGGIMAYITSSGTLDKQNADLREYMALRADLIAAIRLPNTAFKGNAGTEVTTDILFFKKRSELRTDLRDVTWLEASFSEDHGVWVNRYFQDNPEMLLGQLASSTSHYGSERTVLLPFNDGRSLPDLLTEAVARLPQNLYSPMIARNDDGEEISQLLKRITADLTIKNNGYAVVDDTIYQRNGSIMVECPLNRNQMPYQRIRGLTEVKTVLRSLLDAQRNDCDDDTLYALQSELTSTYDSFVSKYGFISSAANSRAYSADPDFPILMALEIPDQVDPKLFHKAAVFTERTIRREYTIRSVETEEDALMVSLHETGRIDPDFMERLLARPAEEILEHLSTYGAIYRDPSISEGEHNAWVTAAAYLSGNVRVKLQTAMEAAENDSRYHTNVTALERVIPRDLTPDEISLRLGTAWIPHEVYVSFITGLLGVPSRCLELTCDEDKRWSITFLRPYQENMVRNTTTYGSPGASASRLIEMALNHKTPKIYMTSEDGTRVINQPATEAAKAKLDELNDMFVRFAWSDERYSGLLARIYNDRFNSSVERIYDGSHLTFPGMSAEVTLRTHQTSAIARILYGGENTLLAHAVGAGKTYEMIAAAMELRRVGIAYKPLIVVPNHIVGQWSAEFMRLYPNANILAATPEDFSKQRRQRLIARATTGDWDAIIIGHSSFGKIGVADDQKEIFYHAECDALIGSLERARAGKSTSRRSIKAMETRLQNFKTLLTKMTDGEKGDAITFEDLGIDYLFIDEAHEFKNLFFTTSMDNISGINTKGSDRATDLLMKVRVLSANSNSPRVCFATGTPIANSVAEMYTMLRYLHIDRLTEMGLQGFDDWASVFGDIVTAYEVSPDGETYRPKTRFARFHNVPELRQIFKEVADVQTSDMLDLPRPALTNNQRTIIKIERSEALTDYVNSLVERMAALKSSRIDPREDNPLLVTSQGRLAALDLRMVIPDAVDDPNSKINVAIRNLFKCWQETQDERLTHMAFCDQGTPSANRSKSNFVFPLYEDMKRKLIAMGVPEAEIAFVQNCKDDEERQKLFERVRKGEVRILFGSTQTMGTGVNVQTRLKTLHHIDPPWRPADFEQREGRILRQGNTNSEVEIFTYVTEGTFDAYSYQTLETKAKFIAQVTSGSDTSRSIDDVDDRALSYSEIKAIASNNPLMLKLFEVEADIRRYNMVQGLAIASQRTNTALIDNAPRVISATLDTQARLKQDLEALHRNRGGSFRITINGTVYDERADAGEAMYALINSHIRAGRDFTSSPVEIGNLLGFPIFASRPDLLILKGSLEHRVTLDTDKPSTHGSIRRIENALANIEARLADSVANLKTFEAETEQRKADAAKPLPFVEELKAAVALREEIMQQLNASTNDNVVEIEHDPVASVSLSSSFPVVEVNRSLPPVTTPFTFAYDNPEMRYNEFNSYIDTAMHQIMSSNVKYHAFLNSLTHFREYSLDNIIAIAIQCSGATMLAGRDSWHRLHSREVIEGGKPIHLLAHIPNNDEYRVNNSEALPTLPVIGVVSAYDISQTTGREITLSKEPHSPALFKNAVAEALKCSIVMTPNYDGVSCDYLSKELFLGENLPDNQMISTMLNTCIDTIILGRDRDTFTPPERLFAEDISYVLHGYYGISEQSMISTVTDDMFRKQAELRTALFGNNPGAYQGQLRQTVNQIALRIDTALDKLLEKSQKQEYIARIAWCLQSLSQVAELSSEAASSSTALPYIANSVNITNTINVAPSAVISSSETPSSSPTQPSATTVKADAPNSSRLSELRSLAEHSADKDTPGFRLGDLSKRVIFASVSPSVPPLSSSSTPTISSYTTQHPDSEKHRTRPAEGVVKDK